MVPCFGNTVRRIEHASLPELLFVLAATMSGARPMRAVGGHKLRAVFNMVCRRYPTMKTRRLGDNPDQLDTLSD